MPAKRKKHIAYAPQPERIASEPSGCPLDGIVMEGPVAAVSDRRIESSNDRRSETAATVLTPAYRDDAHGIFLYHGNCLAILDAIAARHPEGCFDAIFADPPYFLSNGGITCHAGRMVKVDKGDWDKPSEARRSAEGDPQGRAESDERVQSSGAEENHNFNREWLRRCQRVLKPNGTLWVTGTHHVIFSVGYAMQQLGFKILNDIAWEKPNPPPNLSCRYFTHSTETVLWAAKSDTSRHLFNYKAMKAVTGKQMKTVWRFTAPGRAEKTFGKHPTQKPVALVERFVIAFNSDPDSIFGQTRMNLWLLN